MKNKIKNISLALVLMFSCLILLSACGKKDQENTIEFSGVFQSATGDVYLQIDNLSNYDNVDMEYTIDGGENWDICNHYNQTFTQINQTLYVAKIQNYSNELANQTLNVGVRLSATNKLNASPASNFISYKVKPISLVKEVFQNQGNNITDDYEWGIGWGIEAYKLCEKDNKTYKIEKYNYVEDYTNGNNYKYTYVENNWNKGLIQFEYKFITHKDAFYTDYYKSGLMDYEDIVNSGNWITYNPYTGITKQMYESHLENNDAGCEGCYNITFTVLIRAKATQTNLQSVCSPVTVIVEFVNEPLVNN